MIKQKFSVFSNLELFEQLLTLANEENIVNILSILKKKIAKLLQESEELPDQQVDNYLKLVAMFEQFFRFLKSRNIDPKELPGLAHIMKDNNIDETNEVKLITSIEKFIKVFDERSMLNFKNIVDRRFKEFSKWVKFGNKNDLNIVNDAIDFTLNSIEKYKI